MRLYLVRHGETAWNATKKFQGVADIELNELGLLQSAALGEWFSKKNINAIISSDLKRARQTAEAVSRLKGMEITQDPRLREINCGEWEGLTWEEIKLTYKEFLENWYDNQSSIPIPGGESYVQMAERLSKALSEIIAKDYDSVLVVSHGAAIRTLLCVALDMDIAHRSNFELDNTGVCVLDYSRKRDKFILLGSNHTEHLNGIQLTIRESGSTL